MFFHKTPKEKTMGESGTAQSRQTAQVSQQEYVKKAERADLPRKREDSVKREVSLAASRMEGRRWPYWRTVSAVPLSFRTFLCRVLEPEFGWEKKRRACKCEGFGVPENQQEAHLGFSWALVVHQEVMWGQTQQHSLSQEKCWGMTDTDNDRHEGRLKGQTPGHHWVSLQGYPQHLSFERTLSGPGGA